MTVAEHRDLRSAVRTTRGLVQDLDALVSLMEELTAEHEQLAVRHERLAREHEELRKAEEGVRRERDEMAEALAGLRSAYEGLRTQREADRERPRKRRVMVVDDGYSELKLMESILRSAGHDVVTCAGGEQIEERVALEQPDALLLDIVMPNRNGYEILRSLKKDERTKRVRVVVVTARAHESDRIWSKLQGADDYVTKPFTTEQLLAVV